MCSVSQGKACQKEHWVVHQDRCSILVFQRDKLALVEESSKLIAVAKHLAKQHQYQGIGFLKLIEDYQHILFVEAQVNLCGPSGRPEIVYKDVQLMDVDDVKQSNAWRNKFRRLAVGDGLPQGPTMGVIFHTKDTFGFVISAL